MKNQWSRFVEYFYANAEIGFSLDVSRMSFPEGFFAAMEPRMAEAFRQMGALEAGEIANPDEKRQVGHYWLRTPELAPTLEQRQEIETTLREIREFARQVHFGEVAPERGGRFRNLLLVGIGGSALGPQFLADALGYTSQPLHPFFLDNTDPEGIERVFQEIGTGLAETLVVVMSKSGGTKETRNGMVEAETRFEAAGLRFGAHAVAVTQEGSKLDKIAAGAGWLKRFPMWDWVGGRTSVFSAVGLLPCALLGFNIDEFLRGGREMDAATRVQAARRNPAALLALMWYYAGDGKGHKDMVVLPYRDRLGLFARYLQQLVMESLGKELDLQHRKVNQGIVVYGNKGSTDQHAYVQQLREGANNFFATFIQVLQDGGTGLVMEEGATTGDYLHGFLLGTRAALAGNGRESITLTLEQLTPASVGALIALFDRAVGLYASLIGINAYHQPGVEAGKIAAEGVLKLQERVVAHLEHVGGGTAEEIADSLQRAGDVETVYHILRHLAANDRGIKREAGESPAQDRFTAKE